MKVLIETLNNRKGYIAPSRSFKIISEETREIAKKRFADTFHY